MSVLGFFEGLLGLAIAMAAVAGIIWGLYRVGQLAVGNRRLIAWAVIGLAGLVALVAAGRVFFWLIVVLVAIIAVAGIVHLGRRFWPTQRWITRVGVALVVLWFVRVVVMLPILGWAGQSFPYVTATAGRITSWEDVSFAIRHDPSAAGAAAAVFDYCQKRETDQERQLTKELSLLQQEREHGGLSATQQAEEASMLAQPASIAKERGACEAAIAPPEPPPSVSPRTYVYNLRASECDPNHSSEWIQTTLMTTRLAALRSDDGSFAVQTWEKSTDVPKGTTYDFPVERSGLPLGLCSRDGATVELNLH